MDDGETRTGVLLELDMHDDVSRVFMVNITPILNSDETRRGALATFEDVTLIEKKRTELSSTLETLREHSEKIQRQNEHLERLATRDPLTNCRNRRSFFEGFEAIWKNAQRHRLPLSCIMVDVDDFKTFNDNYGHTTGDKILNAVSGVILEQAREIDLVARYGGDEFCMVMPTADLDEATRAAEHLRAAIEATLVEGLCVTASLGVASLDGSCADPAELIDWADQSLYTAKRNGRNRIARMDDTDASLTDNSIAAQAGHETDSERATVPVADVIALMGMIAGRHTPTFDHSQRVAKLCSRVARERDLLQEHDRGIVETAALLHDIGKMAVPDAILLKPGPLTDEERGTMRNFHRLGARLVLQLTGHTELADLVEQSRLCFRGAPGQGRDRRGHAIPLGARILAVADAYDSMTSIQPWRDARMPEEAFAELRNAAGIRFDPEVVESFITTLQNDPQLMQMQLSGRSDEQQSADDDVRFRSEQQSDVTNVDSLREVLPQIESATTGAGASSSAGDTGNRRPMLSDEELLGILHSSRGLLEVCRSTQRHHMSA